MGKSIDILRHAIMLVIRNYKDAMIIILPASILILINAFTILISTTPEFQENDAYKIIPFFTGLLAALSLVWTAVRWHRYALLGERAGFAKLASIWRNIASYLLLSIGLMIFVFIILILPAMAYVFMFDLPVVGRMLLRVPFIQPAFLIVLSIFAVWLMLRLGLVLPAIAIGDERKMAESWHQTRPAAFTLVVVAVAFILITWAPSILMIALVTVFGPAALSVPMVTTPILMVLHLAGFLVGVSILTTLYGHYAEGRPLLGSASADA